MSTTENTAKICQFIQDKHHINDLNNDSLVEIIIHLFDLLQLKTITQYAEKNNKTYSGVAKFNKNIIDINGNKFVIDNE